jgi:hypothetical protein
MENKSGNEIRSMSFSAVSYDSNGVRLDVDHFPIQNILPGESIKDSIVSSSELKEVENIKLTIR